VLQQPHLAMQRLPLRKGLPQGLLCLLLRLQCCHQSATLGVKLLPDTAGIVVKLFNQGLAGGVAHGILPSGAAVRLATLGWTTLGSNLAHTGKAQGRRPSARPLERKCNAWV